MTLAYVRASDDVAVLICRLLAALLCWAGLYVSLASPQFIIYYLKSTLPAVADGDPSAAMERHDRN